MSDPRVEEINHALISGQQFGGGLDDIRVYVGFSSQVGRGIVDVIRNISM